MIGHRAIEVWQERPGEISWRCSCGMRHKHQPMPYGSTVAMKCVDDA